METGKDRNGCLGNVFFKSKGKLTVSEKKRWFIWSFWVRDSLSLIYE